MNYSLQMNEKTYLAIFFRLRIHPKIIYVTECALGCNLIGHCLAIVVFFNDCRGGNGCRLFLLAAEDALLQVPELVILALLCQQLKPKAGDKMMLIINGVGATTHMELNIIFRKAYKELEARGLQVVVSRIQEILTVQEQAGFQMIMAILDEDHIDYLKNKRADAPYWTTIGK